MHWPRGWPTRPYRRHADMTVPHHMHVARRHTRRRALGPHHACTSSRAPGARSACLARPLRIGPHRACSRRSAGTSRGSDTTVAARGGSGETIGGGGETTAPAAAAAALAAMAAATAAAAATVATAALAAILRIPHTEKRSVSARAGQSGCGRARVRVGRAHLVGWVVGGRKPLRTCPPPLVTSRTPVRARDDSSTARRVTSEAVEQPRSAEGGTRTGRAGVKPSRQVEPSCGTSRSLSKDREARRHGRSEARTRRTAAGRPFGVSGSVSWVLDTPKEALFL